tara:strand:+ start:2078 stop:2707 length:630 start_codon:yes stop_codon:yes gene_type:complete
MIEDVFKKRRRCTVFTDKAPPYDLMMSIINKTYDLVPSKQNLMPYKIHVLGPDCLKYKDELYKLTQCASDGEYTPTAANTQCFAPYVFIFTLRLAEANGFVERKVGEGHFYQSIWPETYKNSGNIKTACIEIGLWSMLFTGLCLENDIDVMYTLCFPSWTNDEKSNWPELPFVKEQPLLVMSAGYAHTHSKLLGETKPDIDDMVCFEHE